MSLFIMAAIGGFISFVSTSIGSVLTPLFEKTQKIQKFRLSMDFALGVMLSAVAFSLVGPQLTESFHRSEDFHLVITGLLAGMILISWSTRLVHRLSPQTNQMKSSQIILIFTLVFHNWPEGMAAGAAFAGLDLKNSIPILTAISAQNIAEGLLLAVCIKGLGFSNTWAVLGGVASGIIEFSGALIAGLALESTQESLPFFLSLAGGAMLLSVLMEMKESQLQGHVLQRNEFVAGLAVIPILNSLFASFS